MVARIPWSKQNEGAFPLGDRPRPSICPTIDARRWGSEAVLTGATRRPEASRKETVGEESGMEKLSKAVEAGIWGKAN